MTVEQLLNCDLKYLLDLNTGQILKGTFYNERKGKQWLAFAPEGKSAIWDRIVFYGNAEDAITKLIDLPIAAPDKFNVKDIDKFAWGGKDDNKEYEQWDDYGDLYLFFSAKENAEYILKHFVADIVIKKHQERADELHTTYTFIVEEIGRLESIKDAK